MATVASAPAPLPLTGIRGLVQSSVEAALTAQASLSGSLTGIADAHDTLATQLLDIQNQLALLLVDGPKVFERLRRVEAQQVSFCKEFKGELSKCVRSATLQQNFTDGRSAQLKAIDAAKASLKQDMNSLDQRQQAAVASLEKKLKESVDSLKKQVLDVGNAPNQLLDKEFPQMCLQLSELKEKTAALGSSLSAAVAEQQSQAEKDAERMAHSETNVQSLSAFTKVEFDGVAAKLAPLNATFAGIRQEMSTLVAQSLADNMATVEAKLSTLKSACDEFAKSVSKETSQTAALQPMKLAEKNSAKLSQLEKLMGDNTASWEKDHRTFAERVSRELAAARDDGVAAREWAAKRIESMAEEMRRAESSALASDAAQRAAERCMHALATAEQRVEDVRSRQERGDAAVKNLTKLMEDVVAGPDIEVLRYFLDGLSEGPAARTQCLSCGQVKWNTGSQPARQRSPGRSPSPSRLRSCSPLPSASGHSAPAGSWAAAACGGSGGGFLGQSNETTASPQQSIGLFRHGSDSSIGPERHSGATIVGLPSSSPPSRPTSRPASAARDRPSRVEEDILVQQGAVGSAHAACRAIVQNNVSGNAAAPHGGRPVPVGRGVSSEAAASTEAPQHARSVQGGVAATCRLVGASAAALNRRSRPSSAGSRRPSSVR